MARSRRKASRPAPAPRAARGPHLRVHAPPGVSVHESHIETKLTYAAIAAFGAALLWMILGPHRVGDYFTETDFYGAYSIGARAIQHGVIDPSRYGVVGPGYEIALALAGFLVPSMFLAGELLSMVAVLGGVLLWSDLLRRRADARLALLAVLFMVTNPFLFRYGYSATTDGLAFALQSLALWLLLVVSASVAPLLAGLVTAFAFLTRYNAISLFAAGLIVLLAGASLHARRGRALFAFVLGFGLVVIPWVLYSLGHGGTLALQLHHNIAYDVFARSKGIPWDTYQKEMQPQFHGLWDVIARDPGAVIQREAFNVVDHLRLDARALLGIPVAIPTAAGIAIGLWDGSLRRLWPVWLWAAFFFLSLVPAFYQERYSVPLVPAFAALAATAFASPKLALVLSRPRAFWLKSAVAAIVLALALGGSVRHQREVISQLPVEVLECAEQLVKLRQPGDRIISRKPNIAFHGGVEAVPFPFTRTLPELAEYARRAGARWLYFSWPEAELRPDYRFLLDTSAVVPGLVPRHVASFHPAVLYEITPGFGSEPAWFANDTLRGWHDARAHVLIGPTHAPSLYALAVISWSRGDYDGARSWAEALLARNSNDLRTLLLLGDVCLRQENARRALEVYAHAESLAPGDITVRIGYGWARLLADQPEEAAALWRTVVGQTSDHTTLERMIVLFHSLGDAEAEASASAALARVRGRS